MKILLTGKTGQVGHELARQLAERFPDGEVFAFDRGQLDLANLDQVRELIGRIRPDLIINPAAYTAVDKAESEPELARRINAEAPAAMAQEAQRIGAAMIHYSTDYVFDGTKSTGYAETDQTNPQSAYGRSKLEGDLAVARYCESHWIFRTSWVYGLHGGNFLKTILRLAAERDGLRIVADQFGAPTWARTIAAATLKALSSLPEQSRIAADMRASAGVYNLCASGETTWHEYACHIVRVAQRKGATLALHPEAIAPIATEDYPLPAARPRSSRLINKKIQEQFKLCLPDWRDDLDDCLGQLLASARK